MGKTRDNAIRIGVIAGVTMIVAGPGIAHGLVISETEMFNLSDMNTTSSDVEDDTILEFDLFDSSLGTLTDVTFTLESDKTASQDLFVNGSNGLNGLNGSNGSDGGESSLDLSFDVFHVDVGLGGALFEQDDLLTIDCTIGGEPAHCYQDSDSLNLEFNDTFMIPGGDISNYMNGGGTFDIEVGFFGLSFVEFDGELGETEVHNAASWSGDLTVDYTYTPTSVPEPATLALLGAGLAGLIGLRQGRRRRRE